MKTKEKWLYLPVEVQVRELESKLLLAYYALKRGYRVIIGDHNMVEEAASVYPEGIFFLKGYTHGYRQTVIQNISQFEHVIIELDEEGLLLHDPVKYLRDRMKLNMLHLVKKELCWGKYQKEVIAKAYPQCKEKLYITGNPRFDLLLPKFRDLHKDQTEKVKQQYGSFILINTRFAKYNTLAGFRSGKLDAHTQYIKDMFEEFLTMIKHLCSSCADINIVVRPHPSEDPQPYVRACKPYKNAYIRREGNIINWISAAEAMVHNGCTSSIEAFLLNKPVVTYIPFTNAEFDVDLPNDLGTKAARLEDLVNFLTNTRLLKDESEAALKRKTAVLDKFYKAEEGFSYESILHQLDNTIVAPQKRRKLKYSTLTLPKNKKANALFSGFTEKDIKEFFTKMDTVESTGSRFDINKIGHNVFEISSLNSR
ncbi:hypothetical protein MUN89_20065 [Halobacillus salinarum]|uniref:Surface carbohydrate biosynthesis protein n=1 Tax=Halobacillus salinarum TaxID=2932257 RepID=A0ABY4EPV4_9BACI|nr:surface carbohydrate biosynthesis protein [Halobacillus salinarum]UOQ44126.1 hypothetical protein MUN89_20065 [Halobacillus salinarum]